MRRMLIALIALLAAAPVAAQQTQAFHSEAAEYTVQLPAGWRQMPDAEVEVIREAGARAGQPFTVEAGYRVTDSPTGFPFMVLAWTDAGQTLTPEQFAEALTGKQAQELMQEGADAARPGSRVDAPTWDAENRTVWSRSQMPSGQGAATPFSWTAAMLHPNGSTVIALAYYAAPGEDEGRIRADMLAIVRSLRGD
jgi:hypothetical protein